MQRITIRGKRCELGLGSPALVTLAEVHAAALENRKIARAGGDPLQSKREALAVLSFEQAARKVHELHLPTWRNEKHARDFITSLETYAFPKLGKLRVADVTTADVLGVLMPIWTEKAETARRVRQRIGAVMKWAIAQGWRQDNPAENIDKALPKVDKSPIRQRLRVSDATTEKMAELLSQTSRGLLMYRDELSGWLGGMDRYSNRGDRPFWLEAYGGRSFTVDRKSAPDPIIVDRLSVAVIGGQSFCHGPEPDRRGRGRARGISGGGPSAPSRLPRLWCDAGCPRGS